MGSNNHAYQSMISNLDQSNLNDISILSSNTNTYKHTNNQVSNTATYKHTNQVSKKNVHQNMNNSVIIENDT